MYDCWIILQKKVVQVFGNKRRQTSVTKSYKNYVAHISTRFKFCTWLLSWLAVSPSSLKWRERKGAQRESSPEERKINKYSLKLENIVKFQLRFNTNREDIDGNYRKDFSFYEFFLSRGMEIFPRGEGGFQRIFRYVLLTVPVLRQMSDWLPCQ